MVAKVFAVLIFAFVASTVYMTPIDEQKPFDCPPNEKYYKCELVVCIKKCDHLVHFPPCPSIVAGCYKPACVCIEHYLRDENGICVPVDKCPNQ